ncbi:MAG: DNA-3-methyladenine glycosylase family protein [Candidatus Thorarchaeota archaeon]
MYFRIDVPDDYDLLSSVHSWIYPDIQPVPERTGLTFFGRGYTFDDQRVVLVLSQKKPGARIRIDHSETDIARRTLRTFLKRTFNLDFEIETALKQMNKDPVIAHLVEDVAGIRPYMSPTPFEALIKTIIQQQVSYRSANVFTQRMILGLTKPVLFKNQLWYDFPDANTITEIGPEGLRDFGFGYKVEYIHRVASLVAKGELELDSLIDAPFEEVFTRLKPIRGIGEWTIRVLSIAGLGNFSVFAYDDLVIQKILGNLYNKGTRMTSSQVLELANNWGESSSMVLYLLMCAEVLGHLKS